MPLHSICYDLQLYSTTLLNPSKDLSLCDQFIECLHLLDLLTGLVKWHSSLNWRVFERVFHASCPASSSLMSRHGCYDRRGIRSHLHVSPGARAPLSLLSYSHYDIQIRRPSLRSIVGSGILIYSSLLRSNNVSGKGQMMSILHQTGSNLVTAR